MATKPQRPERREVALSLLNAAIEAVNIAKEASSITPAQAAFSAAGVLLTMIKVHFFPLCDEMSQVHSWPGIEDQRTGLCRARSILRRYLQGP